MTERPLLHITQPLPARVEEALAERFDVRFGAKRRASVAGPAAASEIAVALREADAVLCTVTDAVTAECFEDGPVRARIIANFGVGVNHIALNAAKAAGITVTNTPDVLTDDTADLTIALMLAVMRRLGEGERLLRRGAWGGWHPTQLMGRRLSGKTLGIVGLGRIGRAVAQRAQEGFGMTVMAWSRSRTRASETGEGIQRVSRLEELLGASDVVSLHCPLVKTTRHLISGPQVAQMRSDAILVNTARGPVVDEAALVEALEAGQISGAGLDVYEQEPEIHPGLLGRENVVLLPHLGSATVETREAMGMRALENLAAFFDGRDVPDRVV